MTRFVVLDDDPTGTQEVTGVTAALSWDSRVMASAVDAQREAIHVVTNSRAMSAADAQSVTTAAVRSARSQSPGCELIVRGDSTLRGHLLEEYLAACHGTDTGYAPLLLVPALPAAGRVTVDGVHHLERDEERIPLHETHFSRDGLFSYRSARLREWAEERSGGFFAADRGIEIHLSELRSRGPAAVADALSRLQSAAPAVCVPDAETLADVTTIAEGLHLARDAGASVVVRASPTFVSVYCRTRATDLLPPPPGGGPLLVVCGSYIPNSTLQLHHLCSAFDVAPIELNLDAVVSGDADHAIAVAARATEAALARDRVAVLATPRDRASGMTDLRSGATVIHALASCVQRLEQKPPTIVAKGGITSYEVAKVGLGLETAEVLGPIAQGVCLWQSAVDGRDLNYVVFPGNIGDEGHLTHVVATLLGDTCASGGSDQGVASV